MFLQNNIFLGTKNNKIKDQRVKDILGDLSYENFTYKTLKSRVFVFQ